jgi:lipid A 3-O-deacylase
MTLTLRTPWMAAATALLLAIASPGLSDGLGDAAAGDPHEAWSTPADPSDQTWTLTGYWENDGGPIKRNNITDRHYTNGFGFTFTHNPAWVDRLNERVGGGDTMPSTAAGYIVSQLMFTPEDLDAAELLEDERPYAGYLFAGIYLQRASDTTLDHLQLDLGVVGPVSQADSLQKRVHRMIDEVRPRGWGNQLGNEPTAQLWYRRKWRFDLVDPAQDTAWRLQAIPHAGVALGTVHRHLEGFATVRLGMNLPDDFGPGRLADPTAATGQQQRGWFWYAFARAGGRLVEHNIFLDGNNFRDSHSVEKRPVVGEASVGAVVGYRGDRWATQMNYSQTALSREFRGQDGSDAYASLGISITGSF